MNRLTRTFWRRTGELSIRGVALAVLVRLVGSAGDVETASLTPELFDLLVSVDTLKVAVLGAVFSVLASVVSAFRGDPNQPTTA